MKKEEIYVPIDVNDRLPDETGRYHIITVDNNPSMFTYTGNDISKITFKEQAKYWLEKQSQPLQEVRREGIIMTCTDALNTIDKKYLTKDFCDGFTNGWDEREYASPNYNAAQKYKVEILDRFGSLLKGNVIDFTKNLSAQLDLLIEKSAPSSSADSNIKPPEEIIGKVLSEYTGDNAMDLYLKMVNEYHNQFVLSTGVQVEEMKELLSELAMRSQIAFPTTEQQLTWFDEGLIGKTDFFEKVIKACEFNYDLLCMEKYCDKIATKDYNGHNHMVCEFHYNKLNDEFDEEYK